MLKYHYILLIVLLLGGLSCNSTPTSPSNTNIATTPPPAPKERHFCDSWREGFSPVPRDLSAIDFIDDNTGWIVGDINELEGAILKTTDGGEHWRAISSTDEFLSDVDFIDDRHGWASGYSGTIMGTDDGGQTWQKLRNTAEQEIINSLVFQDTKQGWAVGATGLVLQTTDGGKNWQPLDLKTKNDLWRIRFQGDLGIIVGENGTVFMTTNGGKDWQAKQIPIKLAKVENKKSTSSPHPPTQLALFDAAIIDKDNIWLAGEQGTLLHTTDGGQVWQTVTAKFDNLFRSIEFADAQRGYIVGSVGLILCTTDGGQNWQQIPLKRTLNIGGLKVLPSGRAWAVGRRGYILAN